MNDSWYKLGLLNMWLIDIAAMGDSMCASVQCFYNNTSQYPQQRNSLNVNPFIRTKIIYVANHFRYSILNKGDSFRGCYWNCKHNSFHVNIYSISNTMCTWVYYLYITDYVCPCVIYLCLVFYIQLIELCRLLIDHSWLKYQVKINDAVY